MLSNLEAARSPKPVGGRPQDTTLKKYSELLQSPTHLKPKLQLLPGCSTADYPALPIVFAARSTAVLVPSLANCFVSST